MSNPRLPKGKETKVDVTVRVPETLYTLLRQEAVRTGKPMQALFVEALEARLRPA